MISVITPTIRPELMGIVAKCLKRQTFKDFEWLIGVPKDMREQIAHNIKGIDYTFVQEPAKKEGDFYNLNKTWNALFKKAKGELVVNIVDGLWFEPGLLDSLWTIYDGNPKSVVSCVGHQYLEVQNGKPELKTWHEPRVRTDFGSFYEVPETEMEWCIAAIPMQAIKDVGGIDETYDKQAALSEKEMSARMYKAGYTLWINQDLEYRAIQHPRSKGAEAWDKAYFAGQNKYHLDIAEVEAGRRLKLDYIK